MRWVRSLAAEIFANWHQRRLLRQLRALNTARLDALQDLIRTTEMNDKAMAVRRSAPNVHSPESGQRGSSTIAAVPAVQELL